MKIAVHITSFYGDNYKERIIFLKKIIKNYQIISKKIDIFIHTNKVSKILESKNVKLILHDLENKNPFYLSWLSRPMMEKQKDKYDCFIYSEDDILFSKKNFEYWLKYKEICLKNNHNLGFIRIEKKNEEIFSTDLIKKINYFLKINNKVFAVNDVNSYCAFWIYDKKEFIKFTQSKFWNFTWKGKNIHAFYGIREMSAIGWHGKNMSRYKHTLIPMTKNKLDRDSYILHLTNNHALSNHPVGFGSIKKNDITEKKLIDIHLKKKEPFFLKFLKYKFRKFLNI